MLKLSLPGVDPLAIPVLMAEQAARISAILLTFLEEHGRVQNYGDLKIISVIDDRHNFTILSIAEWITKSSLEHGELKVEQLERKSGRRTVVYDQSIDEQDITFVSTAETHARFLQRLRLYVFSISAGMKEFQRYICKTICTQYPVYEAEVIAIIAAVSDYTNDLKVLDSTLASFVHKRMLCLRGRLVTNEAALPVLSKAVSVKDRFMSLLGRADHAVLARALAELRNGVGEVIETEALLDKFIEKTSIDSEASQPTQATLLATPSTQAKRKRGRPTKEEAAAKAARSNPVATTSTMFDTGMQSASTSHLITDDGPASISPVLNPVKAHAPPKRQHPGDSMWTGTKYRGQPRLRFTRPQVEDEYWSATPDEWHDKSDHLKRLYTHAGYICETEAGMVAPEPCSECKALNHVCEVYTLDARHAQFGGTCARCRIKHNAKCSHVAMSVLGK